MVHRALVSVQQSLTPRGVAHAVLYARISARQLYTEQRLASKRYSGEFSIQLWSFLWTMLQAHSLCHHVCAFLGLWTTPSRLPYYLKALGVRLDDDELCYDLRKRKMTNRPDLLRWLSRQHFMGKRNDSMIREKELILTRELFIRGLVHSRGVIVILGGSFALTHEWRYMASARCLYAL